MSAAEEYDLVVLDNWTAGKILAWTLASRGSEQKCIERRFFGGALPEHRLPPEKEHHPGGQGRLLLPPH